MSLLDVRDLEVGFAPTYESLLHSISFSMQEGEILGICGESGCGKSLTALALMELLPDRAERSGELYLRGRALHELAERDWRGVRGKDIAMIFQDAQQALNPLIKVGRQVEETLVIHHPEMSRRERRERVLDMFERVELEHPEQVADAYPHELSGGMRQRVGCAMALINHPDLLLADEPTTALDLSVQEKILELLKRFNREEKLGILFISHDIRVVRRFCDRVLIYYAGEIVEEGPVEEVFLHPAHVYTRMLLSAMPSTADKHRALTEIPGRVPSSRDIAKHHAQAHPPCIFAGRCPKALPVCRGVEPPLIDLGGGHLARCHLAKGGPDEH